MPLQPIPIVTRCPTAWWFLHYTSLFEYSLSLQIDKTIPFFSNGQKFQNHQKSKYFMCFKTATGFKTRSPVFGSFKTGGSKRGPGGPHPSFPSKVSTSMDLNPWSPMKPYLTNVERRGGNLQKPGFSTVENGWWMFFFWKTLTFLVGIIWQFSWRKGSKFVFWEKRPVTDFIAIFFF